MFLETLVDKHMFLVSTTTWQDHDPNFSSSLDDRVISIRELEYVGRTSKGTRQWKVTVCCGPLRRSATVTDPYTREQESDLLWALEDHPIRQPFESYRGRAASRGLLAYGKQLIDQLGIQEIISYFGQQSPKPPRGQSAARRKTWMLDIEASEVESRFQGLHWEVLENPELWKNQSPAPRIIIRRKVASADLLTHGPMIPIRNPIFRILLVVTHTMASTTSNGRKTANPRLISRPIMDIISRLKKDGGAVAEVQLEIVRPGTWTGFKQHLERRGNGYFHLVHFDVHAKWDAKQGQSMLAFISEASSRKRSWRASSDVAAILVRHSIKVVVINSSRSTSASGVGSSSLAERMTRTGIRAVVAMPYRILNGGAEILMTSFYQSLLSGNWDIARALATARKAMVTFNTRAARFGTTVAVADWIAPILYHNGATEISFGESHDHEVIKEPKIGEKLLQKLGFGDILHVLSPDKERPSRDSNRNSLVIGDVVLGSDMLGRDGDIFEMETRFLIENNILRFYGAPGVGKSTLIHHLCWWWKETALVEDTFYFCFFQKPLLNVEMVCRQLYLAFYPPHESSSRARSPVMERKILERQRSSSSAAGEIFPDDWMAITIETLREMPYLLVIDSLESLPTLGAARTRAEFNELIRKLEGGKSLVVLVSNRNEGWISPNIKHGSYELKNLEISHASKLARSVLEKHRGQKRKFQTSKNKHFLEKTLALLERNALVMELVLPNIATWESSLQQIYVDLLQGSASLRASRAASLYASKSLRMMSDLLGSLDKESQQLFVSLSPFWTVIPKDASLYLMCLVYHGAIAPQVKAVRDSVGDWWNTSAETERAQRITNARTLLEDSGLEKRYENVIQLLLTNGLLTLNPRTIEPADQRPNFYGVHPLLTVFLRQTLDGDLDEDEERVDIIDPAALKRAFLDYYSQKSSAWDSSPENTNKVAAQELRNEETNFLSSILISLQYGSADKCFSTFPQEAFIRMAALSLVDRQLQSVNALIAYFCEKILERFDELHYRIARRKLSETATALALFAAEWLCVYHAESSGPAAFKDAVGKSLLVAKVADEHCPGGKDLLSEIHERACQQKALVVTETMVDGLRLKKPFDGLVTNVAELYTTPKGASASVTAGATWIKLGSSFLRMHSLATQAHLTTHFKPAMREQLRNDLKVLWKGCVKSLRTTILEPFIESFAWVPALLSRTDPFEGFGAAKISSSRFVAYPDFIRSQLYLLIRDPASAKKHLLAGLELSRERGDTDGEKLCHLRLADLAYVNRKYDECIAHAEYIRDIQESFPDDTALKREDHLAYAHLSLRQALCHRHLKDWTHAVENLETSREIARFTGDKQLEYIILRKIATLKQENDMGDKTVAELLLAALEIAYDDNQLKGSALADEQGYLLRRMLSAAQAGIAGEPQCDVLTRIAEQIGSPFAEVRRFVDEVVTREREIVRRDQEGHGVAKLTDSLWRDAECVMFASREGQLWTAACVRWRGGEWERGLRTVDDPIFKWEGSNASK